MENNNKVREYQISNWDKYNLVDNKQTFISLLNILEAHAENLDSLHDVSFNGLNEFCSIYGTFESDRDVVKTLFEFNIFYSSYKEIEEWAKEDAEYLGETPEELIKSEDIVKTTDGYVRRLWY